MYCFEQKEFCAGLSMSKLSNYLNASKKYVCVVTLVKNLSLPITFSSVQYNFKKSIVGNVA